MVKRPDDNDEGEDAGKEAADGGGSSCRCFFLLVRPKIFCILPLVVRTRSRRSSSAISVSN